MALIDEMTKIIRNIDERMDAIEEKVEMLEESIKNISKHSCPLKFCETYL